MASITFEYYLYKEIYHSVKGLKTTTGLRSVVFLLVWITRHMPSQGWHSPLEPYGSFKWRCPKRSVRNWTTLMQSELMHVIMKNIKQPSPKNKQTETLSAFIMCAAVGFYFSSQLGMASKLNWDFFFFFWLLFLTQQIYKCVSRKKRDKSFSLLIWLFWGGEIPARKTPQLRKPVQQVGIQKHFNY